jgi:hypothetical protein
LSDTPTDLARSLLRDPLDQVQAVGFEPFQPLDVLGQHLQLGQVDVRFGRGCSVACGISGGPAQASGHTTP